MLIIESAALIPSSEHDIIPPPYPAPSPTGYKLDTFMLSISVFLFILAGLEVLVSGPTIIPLSIKPGIFLSNDFRASLKIVFCLSVNNLLKSNNAVSKLYVDLNSNLFKSPFI